MQLAQLDRQWIAARIPHQGRMCLLDGVLAWDATGIRCRSASHRDPHNPLRAHGRLGTVCGVEFAAQAMALHQVLSAGEGAALPPRAGYLASTRGVVLHVTRLDDIATDLDVEASLLADNPHHLLYNFAVRSEGRLLLNGRAAIVLEANRLPI